MRRCNEKQKDVDVMLNKKIIIPPLNYQSDSSFVLKNIKH